MKRVSTITESEFKKRFTRERTKYIALMCYECGAIEEHPSKTADGLRCSCCGGASRPIGYLKSKWQKPYHEAAEQEATT